MRRPLPEVRHKALLAVCFGAQLQDLLFPEQIHGKRTSHEVRQILWGAVFYIFWIVAEDQRMAAFVELNEFASHTRIRRHLRVFEIIHFAFQERVLVEQLDHAKGRAAHCQNIHSSIGIPFHHLDNFRCASHVHDALREREQHAELRLIIETSPRHLTVAWFENVQRKVRAGEKNDVEGKERNPFRPHRSQTKSYQRMHHIAGKQKRALWKSQPRSPSKASISERACSL